MLRATIAMLLLMAVSFGLAEPARAEPAVRELTSHREAQLIADLSQRHQMNQMQQTSRSLMLVVTTP